MCSLSAAYKNIQYRTTPLYSDIKLSQFLDISIIMRFTSPWFALASVGTCHAQNYIKTDTNIPPTPPALDYLYTAYVDCLNTLYQSQGPRGIRNAIPIIGGNFTGPRLRGKILDLGADWGVTDPQTGLFSADTRYNLQTDDGANLWLQTSGPSVPAGMHVQNSHLWFIWTGTDCEFHSPGGLHLRVVIETGDEKYYWLNNVVAVAVLGLAAAWNDTRGAGFTLKIDVWHVSVLCCFVPSLSLAERYWERRLMKSTDGGRIYKHYICQRHDCRVTRWREKD